MNTTDKLIEDSVKKFTEKFVIKDSDGDDYGNFWDCSTLDSDANLEDVYQFLREELKTIVQKTREDGVTEDTSDGYHTFKELYEFRKLYNAALFNQWSDLGLYNIHKSKKHHDGELCFGGGWFIVMATLPAGQISNHYELKDWDLFRCEEREFAEKWDGHTAQDVASRLAEYLKEPKP